MIGAGWKLIIFTSMVKRLINTSRNERVTLQVYDTCLQMFLFFGLQRKDCFTHSTLSSDTRGRPALFPLQRHPIVWNCWYQYLMLLGDGGSLLNCRRNARWRETTDSCFTNCSTQNAFCSGVAIIALLRHRPREKRGVGLRKRIKLEHLLFRSKWETYFCVCSESRNGRLKLLQSFWYTLYIQQDAADTVVCAPDDGWRYHPKHVEQFPDMNKLRNVASCWIYIGIYRVSQQEHKI